MTAALIARLASLLLVVALLLPAAPAMATGRTPVVRAMSKGRPTLHRPSYKKYNANGNRWFFQRR